MSAFAEFHFLRPEWLWLLLPAGLLWWLLYRRHDQIRGWREVIDARLLPYLLVNSGNTKRRIQPIHVLLMFWILGFFILAGPAWQREPSPFAEEQSVLILILKMTPSMQAGDVQPTRLIRAVDKIERLLARRPDSRAALVAYAGSAHRVLPFTRDHTLLVEFARELQPGVMPRPGDDLAAAVNLGNQLIAKDAHPGTMVVLADSVDSAQIPELEAARSGDNVVELWAIAAGQEVIPLPGTPSAPALDEANMQAAARALGGSLELISLDESDVQAIDGRVARHMADLAGKEGQRWRDGGYYLLPLLLLLSLFWFRPGWVLRWSE